jgi:serine acetyltransferase
VPDRAVVVGNPARVVSCKGSFEFVRYDHMESDEQRMQSTAIASEGVPDEVD